MYEILDDYIHAKINNFIIIKFVTQKAYNKLDTVVNMAFYTIFNIITYWPKWIINPSAGGRDSSVGKSSASQSGDTGFKSQWGFDSGHPMHEWEVKRLPAVKVILHQLAWLTGA